jgi:hypothetical protein
VAEQWYPVLAGISENHGWRLVSLTRPSCPWAAIHFVNQQLNRVEPECNVWRDHVLQRIASESPSVVVLSDLEYKQLLVAGVERTDRVSVVGAYRDGMEATLAKLTAHNVEVIASTPVAPSDIPTCISAHPDRLADCAFPASRVPADWNAAAMEVANEHGASYVDLTGWLCQRDTCPAVIGRYIVYRDQVHLTEPFAVSLTPELEPTIDRAATDQEADWRFEATTGSRPPLASPVVALTPGVAPAGPWPRLLSDSFSRAVGDGWGTPDSGPAWVTSGGARGDASVDGARGRTTISAAAGGQFERASLGAASLEITASWNLDALPAGAPVAVHFWPRDVDGGDQYRFYISVTPSGDLSATFVAAVGGTAAPIGASPRVGSGYVPGDWWHVRVQASGRAPTTLRARVWKDGTPEPSTWNLEVTDASPSLQTATTAVRLGAYASAGETALPLHAGFDDVLVTGSP